MSGAIAREVLRYRLEGIANEAQARLVQDATSTLVREGQDCSAALFRADGTLIAEAHAIPLLLGALGPALEACLDQARRLKPDERIALNDPYRGGTHLPDLIVIAPAFVGDRLAGFAATIMHHQDIGGMTPGSLPVNATEIHQEGLRLPPYAFARGEDEEQLLALFAANSRTPDTLLGDMRAQFAAVDHAAARLGALAAEPDFERGVRDLIEASEAATRAALAELPAGSWRFEDRLDHDGLDLDAPVPIVVTLTLGGGRFRVDFTDSAPQTRGPINAVRGSIIAAACYGLRAATDPAIATNAGCYRALDLILPERSVVNASAPAAVNARTGTVKCAANAILGALAMAMPERFPAAHAGASLVMTLSGVDARGRHVVGEIVAGGSGASAEGPGFAGLSTDVGNAHNLPVEMLEAALPVRVLRVARRRHSGGAGLHQGGDGVAREYLVLRGPLTLTYRTDRHLSRARGLAGGGDGASAQASIRRADGTVQALTSKASAVLHEGDVLRVETAGGGGWGQPGGKP